MKLPKASVGECRNSKKCMNFKTLLGDGLCEVCWDKGIDKTKDNRSHYFDARPDLKRKKKSKKASVVKVDVKVENSKKSKKSSLIRVFSKVFNSNRYQI